MPTESVVSFVEMIRQSRVLEPEQLTELARLQATMPDPRHLARELIQRNWLTPYQANQLFQGKGGELTLGQYILLERLGEGGMGLVFKARHRRMGRTVAIKVIRKEHIAHAEALRRFTREMQAVASMSHPNIVMAYDGDQVGETHFFAMEYVDGTELGSLLKKHGPPPVPTACDYLRQIALGLQHAHEKGMVHRDIKPSNVLVTRPPADSPSPWGPVVKLLDLGVARLHEPPGGLDSISALTKEGRVVGTPDYMAPEQAANSAKADIRSDIYSLGCTFYCMLAGQLPYPGGTPMEKLLKHRVDQPTPVEKLRPEVPPPVAATLRKMMAKKPEDRYQEPADLVQALDAATVSGSVPEGMVPTLAHQFDTTTTAARPLPNRLAGVRPRGWLLIAGLLFGAGLFGFAVVGIAFLVFGSRNTATTKSRVVDVKDTALRDLAGRVADPSADTDAVRRDLLRFRQEHPGSPLTLEAGKLLMRLPSPLDDLKPAAIPPAERAPALIPGDRRPSFPAEVVAVLGQRAQRHWGAVRATAISPDGRIVASGGDGGIIHLWDANTMQEQALLTGHSGSIYWLGFTSDSRTLLSAANDGSLRFWRGFKPTVNEQRDWKVALPGGFVPVALSPDSQTVAFSVPPAVNRPSAVQLIDLGSINRPGGKPQPRGTIPVADKQMVRALAFSQEGKTLATASDGSPSVQIWDLAVNPPRAVTTLSEGKVGFRTLAFSLEGKLLATGSSDGTVRVYDLSKPEPATPRTLRDSNVPLLALTFIPGGRKLAFSANDRTMRVWDLSQPTSALIRWGHNHQVTSLAAAGSPANPILISGSIDTTVRKWNVVPAMPNQVPLPLKEPTGVCSAVAFLTGDRTVANSHEGDPSIRLWEPLTGKVPPIPAPGGNGLLFASTPDGRTLALCGYFNGQVQVRRQGDSGAFTGDDLPPLPRPVISLAVASDGKTVAVGDQDGLVQVASVAGPKPWKWRSLSGHRGPVRAVAFSPDAKFLASADDGAVRLWTLEKNREVIAPIAAVGVRALDFSPDSKALAAGGGRAGTGELLIWDLIGTQAKPRSVNWKRSHTLPVTALAFTPDGERLVSAGLDGHVLLHSLASGEARVHAQLAGPVHALALASGGRYVATANGNGTVYLIRLIDPLPRGGRQ